MTDAPGASQRGEVARKTKTLKFEGLTLKLPSKMPFNAVAYLGEDMGGPETFSVLEAILGEEQMQEVKALDLDIDQGLELLETVMGKVGVNTGK